MLITKLDFEKLNLKGALLRDLLCTVHCVGTEFPPPAELFKPGTRYTVYNHIPLALSHLYV
jgi:hypothetical protein